MAHQYDRDDRGQPSRDEIRAELDTILAGRAFEHAGRAQEFLRFVVMETLAGRDDRLKGYTIAVDVFARGADFDAQSDPLVRVEAGRLRHRLMEHYQGDGRSSRLRIDLPRGCYVPRFSYAPPCRTRKPRRRASCARLAAAPPALLGARALGSRSHATTARSRRPAPSLRSPRGAPLRVAAGAAGPKLLVLPFSNLSDNRDLDYFAFGMTEEVTVRLGSFKLVVLADTTRVGERQRRPGSRVGSREIQRGLRADRQRAARGRRGPRGGAARRRRERRAAVGRGVRRAARRRAPARDRGAARGASRVDDRRAVRAAVRARDRAHRRPRLPSSSRRTTACCGFITMSRRRSGTPRRGAALLQARGGARAALRRCLGRAVAVVPRRARSWLQPRSPAIRSSGRAKRRALRSTSTATAGSRTARCSTCASRRAISRGSTPWLRT